MITASSAHSPARKLTARLGRWLLILFLAATAGGKAFALQGATGSHDPSTIIKRNGVYHIWTTGNQIYHMTSTDLVSWAPAPTVFAAGTWPGWITNYVPGFQGTFWAPECIFMNGQYYMYYSCSLGGRACAIGVATSPDLATWTDQGMVVYSDNSSSYGSIDPAIFADANGLYWMTFGSHLTGIWSVQIDPATGKRIDTNMSWLAGTSPWCEHEASYVMQQGGYYYLFYNKGICCAGSTSTYYVQMGRATSPTGPYLDRNGVDLKSGGGTDFLVTQRNYIGPGHVGRYTENGTDFLTYHYYDGNRTGTPTLAVGRLSWDAAGWPVASQDWLPAGTYTIANQNSGKVWAAAGCSTATGQAVVQTTATGQPCQQWRLVPLGSGVYKVSNVLAGLNADITGCLEAAGTPIGLKADSPLNCQRFRVEKAADGSLVLASIFGNRVVEVPNGVSTDGTQLALWDYNGFSAQHWLLAATPLGLAAAEPDDALIQVAPNPAPDGCFSLTLPTAMPATVTVADLGGRLVYRQQLAAGPAPTAIAAGLRAGVYVVRVTTARGVTTRRLLVP